MSIINRLSSAVGDKTEQSNIEVAALCLERPALLKELGDSLDRLEPKLLGDSTEVFTMVAQQVPELIVPYAPQLIKLLKNKNTRVRWEAAHALSLIAVYVNFEIQPIVSDLTDMLRSDNSVIVRDFTVDIIAGFAKAGKDEAAIAFPILKEALVLWNGKHAGRALKGLANTAANLPGMRKELYDIAVEYSLNDRGVIKKEAKALMKAVEK